jgi:hypothetical protein
MEEVGVSEREPGIDTFSRLIILSSCPVQRDKPNFPARAREDAGSDLNIKPQASLFQTMTPPFKAFKESENREKIHPQFAPPGRCRVPARLRFCVHRAGAK